MVVVDTEEASQSYTVLQPVWHPCAPAAVKHLCTRDDLFDGWKNWQKHLRQRKEPKAPPFLKGKQPAILWGWPEAWQSAGVRAVAESPAAHLERLLEQTSGGQIELSRALELVALAYAMPKLAAEVPGEVWWRAAERLHEIGSDAQHAHVDWPGDAPEVLRQQLLAGELPLATGFLFPELRSLRSLREAARSALSEGLVELTDGQGLPHAKLLPVLGPLFACWTRCRWLGKRLKGGSWSGDAELQYQWLVRHTLRLADSSQHFVLTTHDDVRTMWTTALFAAALELAGDRGDYAAAAQAISAKLLPKRPRISVEDLPKPSLNSDWSGIAVMANGWCQRSTRCALSYPERQLAIDLLVDGDQVLAGKWESQTTCHGEPVEVVGEWERLCWESGKRYDFLELGIELSHGLKLERQILFARKDRVLYLADIVVANDASPRRIEHSFSLPLAADVRWQPESETRDGVLTGKKARIAALPLALKEWRADPRGGALSVDKQRLTISQAMEGCALCCPLLLDLDRQRTKRERTWRQLTVAENLEVVPRDVAVGFRAQSGDDQFLFYRSLGPAGNRTFLGQNTSGEFTAGPFSPTGKYKEWISIEAV